MAPKARAARMPPPRAAWLRALLLERERIANHLGDLGFLGNDAGLAFGLAQFSRLKEDLLRLNAELFGHRYLMDAIVPGGVARDLGARAAWSAYGVEADALEETVALAEEHLRRARRACRTASSTCGRVTPRTCRAARPDRAGGARQRPGAGSAREQLPVEPYDRLDVRMATPPQRRRRGARRRALRRGVRIAASDPRDPRADAGGERARRCRLPPQAQSASGWVEGWRGEVLVALETGADGAIARCHATIRRGRTGRCSSMR